MTKRPCSSQIKTSVPVPVVRLLKARARRLGVPVAAYVRRAVCNELARVESSVLPAL